MGGEHKLDLTSDVTHLLVGDTDTPKYKYVAKEREDVYVLRPEWVDAVREQWMEAKQIDLDSLHREHRMPTLAGSKVCITGFDDLNFRARLQKNVLENGGEYTGDLTKDVTHLIARKPEGKKYEYGMQWQKKVVSLQWYKDTLDRGMQLEESAYHPTISPNEQGVGAWNRGKSQSLGLGKRARVAEQPGPEPARKLRRVASARLNSQNDNMWSDLTHSRVETSIEADAAIPLKSPKSMPELREPPEHAVREGDATKDMPRGADEQAFEGRYFAVHGFDPRRDRLLRGVVNNLNGTLVESMTALRELSGVTADNKILLVPHQTPLEQLPSYDSSESTFAIASELWVEHCMHLKLYTPPRNYPLGRLLARSKPPGFGRLVINATGFVGIVPNHIDKMVRLFGAQYEQTFKVGVSLLICNRQNQNQAKLDMAKRWGIPVVAESWLWACIQENRRASFEAHALYLPKAVHTIAQPDKLIGAPAQLNGAEKMANETAEKMPSETGTMAAHVLTSKQFQTKSTILELPGSDFALHDKAGQKRRLESDNVHMIGEGRQHSSTSRTEHALQPISHNLSPKRPTLANSKSKKRLFQTLDCPSSDVENQNAAEEYHAQFAQTAAGGGAADAADAKSLNSEIQDFLDMKSKLKEKASEDAAAKGGAKRKLLGRALSNLSNASSTSHVRQSRASSVDTVNTDGVGSEIGMSASLNSKQGERSENGKRFVGRAKSKMSGGHLASSAIMAAAEHGLEEQQWSEEAPAPALTQLVYEDPEEAIQLRESLAAKRRQRSKLGQKDTDPRPPRQRDEPKRIRDDDLVMGAWGGGRRTRQKAPQGVSDF
jgi:DNA replication regulator DPB11